MNTRFALFGYLPNKQEVPEQHPILQELGSLRTSLAGCFITGVGNVLQDETLLGWKDAYTHVKYISTQSPRPLVRTSIALNNRLGTECDINGLTVLNFNTPIPINAGNIFIVVNRKSASGTFLDGPGRFISPTETRPIDQELRITYNVRLNGEDRSWADVDGSLNTTAILSLPPATTLSTITGFGTIKGDIGALIVFNRTLTSPERTTVETILKNYYLAYSGPIRVRYTNINAFEDELIYYDLTPEVFDSQSATLTFSAISLPAGLTLNIQNILSGSISTESAGTIIVRVTNNVGLYIDVDIPYKIYQEHPVYTAIKNVPGLDTCFFAGTSWGYDSTANIWSDHTRRKNNLFAETTANAPTDIEAASSLNNKETIYFNSGNSYLRANSYLAGKTIFILYEEINRGVRKIWDGFANRYSDGRLFSAADGAPDYDPFIDTFYATRTYVNKVQRLSGEQISSYKLPTNYPAIIQLSNTASLPASLISGGPSTSYRGNISAIITFTTTTLTESQINTVVHNLANYYIPPRPPEITDDSTFISPPGAITIDCATRVTNVHGGALTFIADTLPAGLSLSAGVITGTLTVDGLYPVSIDVTNTFGLSSRLSFIIDLRELTHPLWLAIKSISTVGGVFIGDERVVSAFNLVSEWNEYTHKPNQALQTTTLQKPTYVINEPGFNFHNVLQFNTNGLNNLVLGPGFTQVKTAIICYRYDGSTSTGSVANIFGQTADTDWLSGPDGKLLDSTLSADFAYIKVNKYIRNKDYKLNQGSINIISLHSEVGLSIDSFGKDRIFNSSVRGAIAAIILYDRVITSPDMAIVENAMHLVFKPDQTLTLLHINNNFSDTSFKNKTITATAPLTTTHSKFGSTSATLYKAGAGYTISVPNNSDFIFNDNDFTIAFYLKLINVSTDLLKIYSQNNLYILLQLNTLYVNTTPDLIDPLIIAPVTFTTEFNHVALCRVDKEYTLYFNGVAVGTKNTTAEVFGTQAAVLGDVVTGLATSLELYIDEVLIDRGARYTTNFSVPIAPYTSG